MFADVMPIRVVDLQVVLARDRGEHLADQLLLVGDGHVAITEMGGAGGLVVHAAIIATAGKGDADLNIPSAGPRRRQPGEPFSRRPDPMR